MLWGLLIGLTLTSAPNSEIGNNFVHILKETPEMANIMNLISDCWSHLRAIAKQVNCYLEHYQNYNCIFICFTKAIFKAQVKELQGFYDHELAVVHFFEF